MLSLFCDNQIDSTANIYSGHYYHTSWDVFKYFGRFLTFLDLIYEEAAFTKDLLHQRLPR